MKITAENTYAEVLVVFRNQIKPEESNEIKTIKRTLKGGVLVVFGKNTYDSKAFQKLSRKPNRFCRGTNS